MVERAIVEGVALRADLPSRAKAAMQADVLAVGRCREDRSVGLIFSIGVVRSNLLYEFVAKRQGRQDGGGTH